MKTHYCDNRLCEAEATTTVQVSVNAPGDEKRRYCACCHEAYVVGIQHGRLSENPNAYKKLYKVRWEIDIHADTPRKAAEKALEIQRNKESTATVFEVRENGQTLDIDLLKEGT